MDTAPKYDTLEEGPELEKQITLIISGIPDSLKEIVKNKLLSASSGKSGNDSLEESKKEIPRP